MDEKNNKTKISKFELENVKGDYKNINIYYGSL